MLTNEKCDDLRVSGLARWTAGREVKVRFLTKTLSCVLGKDHLLLHCLSPPRYISGTGKLVLAENIEELQGRVED